MLLCAAAAAARSGAEREGSLLLRVEVVAQVLESTAGEMLSAAGKSHCQEEGREGGREQRDGTLNSLVTRHEVNQRRPDHHCRPAGTPREAALTCCLCGIRILIVSPHGLTVTSHQTQYQDIIFSLFHSVCGCFDGLPFHNSIIFSLVL